MSPFWAVAVLPTFGVALSYLIIKYVQFIWNFIITFRRDIELIYQMIKINLLVMYVNRNNLTVHQYFDNQVKKMPNKPCFFFEEEVWTYKKVQDESYKIANYFQTQGYGKGDCIALLMENRPDYATIWLGLSRIGVVTSLVNFNLRFKALEHCVEVSKCKGIIFGTELSEAIQDVIQTGGFKYKKFFCFEDRNHNKNAVSMKHTNVTKEIEDAEPTPTMSGEKLGINDEVLHVFTSGTTGLPKAVIVTHMRAFLYSISYIRVGLRQDDVLFTPVPLYHVMGGIMGVTTALFHGIPQVIVRKFSASKFWDQCIKYNVTVSQYLGEILRYLLNQPEKPVDKLHKVRKFFGNGVNPAIWPKFVERFNNVTIVEHYGSTEGNISTVNTEGHFGACGYHPIWALPMLPVCIAKVDDRTKEIIRDAETGLVKMTEIGEPGEYLARIIKGHPIQQFIGYTDHEATENKIIRDVKMKGDAWFKTGDILQMDELGYLYFKDRAGDTFKWKGENVSTAEVEQVVTKGAGMKGCVVYGVEIPDNEGRCGMAVISDPNRTLDLDKLATEVIGSLPKYAYPLFLRVIHREMDMTGTFKLQKLDLQKEGFNISKIQDAVYFLKGGQYVPLDSYLYNDIISGSIRV